MTYYLLIKQRDKYSVIKTALIHKFCRVYRHGFAPFALWIRRTSSCYCWMHIIHVPFEVGSNFFSSHKYLIPISEKEVVEITCIIHFDRFDVKKLMRMFSLYLPTTRNYICLFNYQHSFFYFLAICIVCMIRFVNTQDVVSTSFPRCMDFEDARWT